MDIDVHLTGGRAAADVHVNRGTGWVHEARRELELRGSYIREVPEFPLADGRIIVEVQVAVACGKNTSLNAGDHQILTGWNYICGAKRTSCNILMQRGHYCRANC